MVIASEKTNLCGNEVEYMFSDIKRHAVAVERFFAEYAAAWEELAHMIAAQLRQGKKLLLCGNGGSACDAMHIAGEFVGRFVRERQGLAAIALSADAGILTAVGNDYGFERVFSRQIEALGHAGDVLIAMSTSGSSPNIVAALEAARQQGVYRVLLTGERGRGRADAVEQLFAVSETDTARIQEVHMLALHLLAGRVEQLMMHETT
jgi:D-sedoheptulose 7-phosphate isomerase